MNKFILASGSPRRKELLGMLVTDFDIITSKADEHTDKVIPYEVVMNLALIKADAVKKMLNNDKTLNKDKLVIIGADTIVCHNGKILGKPADKAEAVKMITELSGNVHEVYTGVAVLADDKIINFYEKTLVSVVNMTKEEIDKYTDTQEPYDKAGAYGIQGLFSVYIDGINGDYNNVVGLPVSRLYRELRKASIL